MRRVPARSRPIVTSWRHASAPPRRRPASSICSRPLQRERDRISGRGEGRCAGLGRSDRQLRSTASSTDEIKVRVLHSGVGAITESDVTLAAPRRCAAHRLQRPPQRQGDRPLARRDQGRAALLRRDLRPHRGSEATKWPASSRRSASRRSSAWPRSCRSSRPARRTRRQVCSSRMVSSARASTRASRARMSSSRRRPSLRCAGSRTMSARFAPAWSAARSCSTRTTSRSATRSNCSRSRSARGRCNAGWSEAGTGRIGTAEEFGEPQVFHGSCFGSLRPYCRQLLISGATITVECSGAFTIL